MSAKPFFQLLRLFLPGVGGVVLHWPVQQLGGHAIVEHHLKVLDEALGGELGLGLEVVDSGLSSLDSILASLTTYCQLELDLRRLPAAAQFWLAKSRVVHRLQSSHGH